MNHLSSLWAKQLHLEFDNICWQYNIDLKSPSFEISQAKVMLGSWHADSRTIRISSHLIINHGWAVTVNVLKHEVAHQICSEIFQSCEVPHGKAFIYACDLLGLSEEYRSASGDLPEVINILEDGNALTVAGQQYISKIEKLLALAKSSNEHEAVLAMEKANEMMAKYNLSQLNSRENVNYAYKIINRKKKRIESYQRNISGVIRDFFHVRVVYSSMYDPLLNQTHKTIEIFGTQENVVVAEYCYHFLENQLPYLWAQNRHKYSGKTRTEKNSYYLGLLQGFRDKLQRQQDDLKDNLSANDAYFNKIGDISALTVMENQNIDVYISKRFPKLSSVRRNGAKIYQSTYDEGVVAGEKITLNKGVDDKTGNQGKFLC